MINIGRVSEGVTSKEVLLEITNGDCYRCISHCSDSDGYVRIRFKGKHERLFRVLYMLKYGDIPQGYVIRHKCDNTWCCNVNHLEIGTQKDNVNDMILRNRHSKTNLKSRGEHNSQSKLTDEQVIEIYKSTLGYKRLSKKYNVSATNIRNIKKGLQWRWLTEKLDKQK